MSVMMGLRIAGDPARVEQALKSDPDRLKGIAQRARDAGCLHHSFYANEAGGEVLVVDEWSGADSFLRFFESSPDIGEMMGEAGVRSDRRRCSGASWTRRTGSDASASHRLAQV